MDQHSRLLATLSSFYNLEIIKIPCIINSITFSAVSSNTQSVICTSRINFTRPSITLQTFKHLLTGRVSSKTMLLGNLLHRTDLKKLKIPFNTTMALYTLTTWVLSLLISSKSNQTARSSLLDLLDPVNFSNFP